MEEIAFSQDFDEEDVEVIEERKDFEDKLLSTLLSEESQTLSSNVSISQTIITEELDEESVFEIENRKNIEEKILINDIKEEFNKNQMISSEDQMPDLCDDETDEEIETIKNIEEDLLFNHIEEEKISIFQKELTEEVFDNYEDYSIEIVEKIKEMEENTSFNLLEEENISDFYDIISQDQEELDSFDKETSGIIESIKEDEELLFLKEIEEENNFTELDDIDELEDEVKIEIFPVPDCSSSCSNEEKRSVASNEEIEPIHNVPEETPMIRKSMIPVQSGRRIPLPREVFETPSFRTQGKEKFDIHLLSEMKPKARNGSKVSSSIPVNQGRKQMNKKAANTNNKKAIKEEVKPQTNNNKANIKKTVNHKVSFTNETQHQEKNSSQLKQQPPKTISKKQLKDLTERLAPITPAGGKGQSKDHSEVDHTESTKLIPQTPCTAHNPDIFNRLFELSTCKKKMPNAEEEKVEPVIEVQPTISAKSNHLAMKKDIDKVCNVVGEVDECNKENLDRIMRELKIIDSTTTEEEMNMIEKEYKQCLVDKDNSIYSAKKLEAKILDSLALRRHRKFNVFVNRRLAIVRANDKLIVEQPEEKPEPVKCSSTMQKETFARLITTKAIAGDNQNENDITLKKCQEQKIHFSKASQAILQKSQRSQEIMDMPLDQRDSYLMKLRNQSIQKLEETLQKQEEKELNNKPSNLGALPSFYEQIHQELKQHPSKQIKKENEKESFKPKTMSYNDFQKMKEKVYGNEPKVAGVEERIKRLRLARIERNELQEALDPRALPTELKNMKKKKNVNKKNLTMNSTTQLEEAENNAPADEIDNVLGI